jgi:hypothetical protein
MNGPILGQISPSQEPKFRTHDLRLTQPEGKAYTEDTFAASLKKRLFVMNLSISCAGPLLAMSRKRLQFSGSLREHC